jgi:hypothetical protein
VRSTAPARHRRPPRRGHVVVPTLAAAAILGIGGVGASAALSGGGGHSTDTARVVHPHLPAPAPAAAAAPSTAATTSPTATTSPAAARSARPLPDFAITVTGRLCWVQVVGPRGHVLIAAIVRHGRTLTYRQRPLVVTLGDAGAVRLVLHHHAQTRPAGRRGEVLRFTVR